MRRRASCRLLFGSEPFPGRREDYRLDDDPFPKEVEEYWLIGTERVVVVVNLVDTTMTGNVD